MTVYPVRSPRQIKFLKEFICAGIAVPNRIIDDCKAQRDGHDT